MNIDRDDFQSSTHHHFVMEKGELNKTNNSLTSDQTPSKLPYSGQKESHSILSLLNGPIQSGPESVRLPSLFSQPQERQTAPKYYLPESSNGTPNEIRTPREILVISDGEENSPTVNYENQSVVNTKLSIGNESIGQDLSHKGQDLNQNLNQHPTQNFIQNPTQIPQNPTPRPNQSLTQNSQNPQISSNETTSTKIDDSKLKLTKSGKPRKPRMTKKEKEAKLAEAQLSNGLIAAPLSAVKDGETKKKTTPSKRKNEQENEESKSKKNKKESTQKESTQKGSKEPTLKEATPKPEPVPNPLTPLPAPSLLDVIDKGDRDRGTPDDPVIALDIPLCSDVNPPGTTQVVFNLMKLCEDKYGFKAMNPHAKLPQDLEGEDDVEILDDDGDDEPEEEDLSKKQNRKIGKYDVNDPFIDDAELLWEEQRVGTADGFFVYYGPLSEASVKVEKDAKKPSKSLGKKTASSPKRKAKPATKKKSEEVPNTPVQTVVVEQVTPSVT